MIELSNVSKAFGDTPVLRSIEIAFEKGSTHVLLGPSGCGKSTLLRLIMGLTQPDSGEIRIEGEDIRTLPPPELRRRMGYVVQEGGLFPHLTAAQNVTLVAQILKWPEKRIRDRLLELSQLVGFEESVLNRYPQQLSGGQRQRVGLIRALMLDPSILLLDEPLGALDPIVRADLQEELKQIFNRLKKTVLVVTHDISEAAFFGHSVTLIQGGQVLQHGSFSDLVRTPSDPFVTRFLVAQKPSQILMEAFKE